MARDRPVYFKKVSYPALPLGSDEGEAGCVG